MKLYEAVAFALTDYLLKERSRIRLNELVSKVKKLKDFQDVPFKEIKKAISSKWQYGFTGNSFTEKIRESSLLHQRLSKRVKIESRKMRDWPKNEYWISIK